MITAIDTFRTASFVPMTQNYNHRIVYAVTSDRLFGLHSKNIHCLSHTSSSGPSSSSLSAAFSLNSLSLSSSVSSEFDTTNFLLPDNPLLSPLAVVLLAIVLLVSAQTFINGMLEGDQGLGAFLRDGSGYNRSGYRPNKNKNNENGTETKDPLPWLKLPKLDFVEVAGQESRGSSQQLLAEQEEQERVYQELDRLKEELNRELLSVRRRRLEGMEGDDDEMAKAKLLKAKLEGLMRAYGIEYETDE